MATTNLDALALETTLAVTGAATLSSTLDAGASTLASASVTAGATVGTTFQSGLTSATYWTTYAWMKSDGVNPVTFGAIRLYDWGANAYKRSVLHNGTLTWV